VAQPVSYILVGGSGHGYGDGRETLVDNGSSPAAASVTVTLTNNVPGELHDDAALAAASGRRAAA
jgi:hypothetical protein